MKIQTTLESTRIKITEPMISDIYFIEQAQDGRFYVTSNNGYNGYEGEGFNEIEKALKQVKNYIKEYFSERCEQNPKGW